MLKYALNVELIVEDITFEKFVSDIRIYYSVMKNIEIIGEAANMLTRHFKEVHSELPWRQIVSMRNVLVHGYAQVTDIDLWQTATSDIHPLRIQIQSYLNDIDWEKWQEEDNPYTEIDSTLYKKAIETARKMKRKNYPIEEIAEITGLSVEELNKL